MVSYAVTVNFIQEKNNLNALDAILSKENHSGGHVMSTAVSKIMESINVVNVRNFHVIPSLMHMIQVRVPKVH